MYKDIERALGVYKKTVADYRRKCREINEIVKRAYGKGYQGSLDWPKEEWDWKHKTEEQMEGMEIVLGLSDKEIQKIIDEVKVDERREERYGRIRDKIVVVKTELRLTGYFTKIPKLPSYEEFSKKRIIFFMNEQGLEGHREDYAIPLGEQGFNALMKEIETGGLSHVVIKGENLAVLVFKRDAYTNIIRADKQ